MSCTCDAMLNAPSPLSLGHCSGLQIWKRKKLSRDVDNFRVWGYCIGHTHRCLRISTPRTTSLSAMVKPRSKQKRTSFTVYSNHQAMHHRHHHLYLSLSVFACATTRPPLLFKRSTIRLITNKATSNKIKFARKTIYLSKHSSSIYPNLS
jgi:hypothetical protein